MRRSSSRAVAAEEATRNALTKAALCANGLGRDSVESGPVSVLRLGAPRAAWRGAAKDGTAQKDESYLADEAVRKVLA